MRLTPVTLDSQLRGDSWPGLTIPQVLIDGAQPTYNLSSVRMQFRNKNGTLGQELNNDPTPPEGSITINDVATWEIVVDKQILALTVPAGKKWEKYYWDIECTDSNGDILTIAAGTIKIYADQTYD